MGDNGKLLYSLAEKKLAPYVECGWFGFRLHYEGNQTLLKPLPYLKSFLDLFSFPLAATYRKPLDKVVNRNESETNLREKKK
ncbi:unnamed protein product [Leptosia nina]|uniref:LAGLIDADG homing endonuclease n=1 Tax=Leptosia nina TaxID=320188 RepID=A0AAV1J6E7_9NEOP